MYQPATSLDDLVETAPLKDWWDQPGHWGYLNQFRAFGPREKTESKEVVEVYLRRAVGEVLALKEAGKLAQWCKGGKERKWNPPPRGGLFADKAVIEVNNGVGSVKNGSEIIAALEDKYTSNVWRNVKAWLTEERAQEMVKDWDASWKEIRLDDELKFAVSTFATVSFIEYRLLTSYQIRKRLFQFTGNYIPDARLGAATTVSHLLVFGTKQPKPTKLAEELDQKALFEDLANVRRQDTKIRPIQKETEVGRWKVIEEELEKRGLPATGTGALVGNKESKRLRGVQ